MRLYLSPSGVAHHGRWALRLAWTQVGDVDRASRRRSKPNYVAMTIVPGDEAVPSVEASHSQALANGAVHANGSALSLPPSSFAMAARDSGSATPAPAVAASEHSWGMHYVRRPAHARNAPLLLAQYMLSCRSIAH